MKKNLSLSSAARELGVCRSTLQRYIKNGLLTVYRLPGGHIRVSREAVENLKTTKRDRLVADIIGKIECAVR